MFVFLDPFAFCGILKKFLNIVGIAGVREML